MSQVLWCQGIWYKVLRTELSASDLYVAVVSRNYLYGIKVSGIMLYGTEVPAVSLYCVEVLRI